MVRSPNKTKHLAFFKYAEASETPAEGAPARTLYVVMSSDKGLCGGIHSAVSKAARSRVTEGSTDGFFVIGDRARTQLSRGFTKNMIVMSAGNVGKNGPTYEECAMIADEILQVSQDFDQIKIIYNSFKSVISYEPKALPVFRKKALDEAPGLMQYEQSDEEALANLEEFHLANALYWALAEGQASEMSARRTAMENATKNAGEMIDKLTLIFNRQRQASITNELVDIITVRFNFFLWASLTKK